jgi:hypothetical protein
MLNFMIRSTLEGGDEGRKEARVEKKVSWTFLLSIHPSQPQFASHYTSYIERGGG